MRPVSTKAVAHFTVGSLGAATGHQSKFEGNTSFIEKGRDMM